MLRAPALVGCLLLAAAPAAAQAVSAAGNTDPMGGFTLSGRVVDLSGAGVSNALVRAAIAGRPVADTVTAADGSFTLRAPRTALDVTASAHPLAPAWVRVVPPTTGDAAQVRLVLGAPVFSASVTVTVAAAPGEAGTEGSSSVVTGESIGSLPSRALDEALAATPGFSLFRRASSRTANPTAQGVSLRGLGASGASRALVTADGFPANDPFGGWVYWSRLPMVAIDRVEVARGGRSERYGADALGGVVSILTVQPARPFEARFLAQAGSRGTGRVSGFAGLQRGEWTAVFSAEAGRSGRAPIVGLEDRGPVDTPAGTDHAAGLVAVGWAPSTSFVSSVRVNPFGEQRANGTPQQRNDTRAGQAAVLASGTARGWQWDVRAWGQWTRFRQSFSVIAADRASERPANRQRVESAAGGARVRWDQRVGPAALAGGFEIRHVEADNLEGPAPMFPASARSVGGSQRGPSFFWRISFPLASRVRADAGARWEWWRNTPSHLPEARGREASFSPRATITWAPAQPLVAHAAVYRALRAPTLNELYRGFRVGAITTRPNENLEAEWLTGAEGGLGFTRRGLALRATGWWSRLDDPVANVTIAALERQRQNVGAVHARGAEIEIVARPSPVLESVTVVALTRSIFRDPLRPALDGRRVPQVPGTQWSSRLRYHGGPLWGAVEVRRVGRQFEDDRNELALRPALSVDLAAGYRVGRRVELLLTLENAGNAVIEVGRTPVPTIGLPRGLHIAVRIDTR